MINALNQALQAASVNLRPRLGRSRQALALALALVAGAAPLSALAPSEAQSLAFREFFDASGGELKLSPRPGAASG